MRLSNCYHPKLITNRYTGEQQVVRCGKCPACLNARSAYWVQRLNQEFMQHPFCWFATFQYDEQNVNQFVLLREEDNPNQLPSYINADTGQIISLSDVENVTPADIEYCKDTMYLLVHNYKDFQNFIKSLRQYAKRKYNANFRYFAAFEYGPQTYRPHVHSVFFLDAPLLSQDFARLLSLYWSYGHTFDPHILSSSNSQYVASYLNSTANLPKIYLHKDIKQKALFSRKPPIGSYTWSKENFREFFNSETLLFTIYEQTSKKFCDVPLWRFIQSRLYPRITAFNSLSHFDRVALYRKGFCTAYRKLWLSAIKRGKLTSEYWRPYFMTAFSDKNKRDRFVLNPQSLARFCYIVRHVADMCSEYGVSVNYYVSKIENFYEKKSKSDFRQWCEMQNEYFVNHPLSDFLLLNPNFYILTKSKKFESLKPWLRFYLELYMPNCFHSGDTINYKYTDCFAYNELVHMHNKILHDNTKQKHGNDYVLSHRDKFNNIITYNQNIQSYVKIETI